MAAAMAAATAALKEKDDGDAEIWQDARSELPDADHPRTSAAADAGAVAVAAGAAGVENATAAAAATQPPVSRPKELRQPRPPNSAQALFLEKPVRCRRSRINFLVDEDDEVEEERHQFLLHRGKC